MRRLARSILNTPTSFPTGAAPPFTVPPLLLLLPSFSNKKHLGIGSHVSDNDPELIEKHKKRQHKGKTVSNIREVEGWDEKLGSDSEAIIKAERYASNKTIKELQDNTIKTLKEEEEVESVETKEEKEKKDGGK
jgi:hypothetical protein